MRMRKRREAKLETLECGAVYRIAGAWHRRVLGFLAPGNGVAAGTYAGQIRTPEGVRYLFRDVDGDEYVVTPPGPLTGGLVAARVYKLRGVE